MHLKLNHSIWLAYIFYIAAIYSVYVCTGSFIYDDWSVSLLGTFTDSVITAYTYYFPNFTNRPLAPLYYGLISRFGADPLGYILVNCALWCGAVLLIGLVVGSMFGYFVGAVFIYLASIPLVSSTLIFSPGMQSLGSFALFLWALSFSLLYFGMIKRSYSYVCASLIPIFLMVLSYEVCFPLLALTIALPLMSVNFKWVSTRDKNLFLVNLLGIFFIVTIALIYQKILAPYWFEAVGDISRLRAHSLKGLSYILHLTNVLLTEDLPTLLRRGISITKNNPISKELIIPFILGSIGLLLSFNRANKLFFSPTKNYLLGVFACFLGFVGVGFIHWGAAVAPTLFGYSNRGLGSLSILIPFLIAVLLSYGLNRSKILDWIIFLTAIGIFAIQLSCFMLVRSNFIEISRLQKIIMLDLEESFYKHGDVPIPRTVLADVPEFLPTDYNGENIYSDEVHDWAMSLSLFYPGVYIRSATLTTKKVCASPKRAYIQGDNLILVGPDNSIPIKNLWFYRYDVKSRQSSLVEIKSPKQMQDLLDSQFICPSKKPI